jgi:hypothetical protein
MAKDDGKDAVPNTNTDDTSKDFEAAKQIDRNSNRLEAMQESRRITEKGFPLFQFNRTRARPRENSANEILQLEPAIISNTTSEVLPCIESPETISNICFPEFVRNQLVSTGYNLFAVEIRAKSEGTIFQYHATPCIYHDIPAITTLDLIVRAAKKYTSDIHFFEDTGSQSFEIKIDDCISFKLISLGRTAQYNGEPALMFSFTSTKHATDLLTKIMRQYATLYDKSSQSDDSPHMPECVPPLQLGVFAFNEEAASELETQIQRDYTRALDQDYITGIETITIDSSIMEPTCSIATFAKLYQPPPLDNNLVNSNYVLRGITANEGPDPTFTYRIQPFVDCDIEPLELIDIIYACFNDTDEDLEHSFQDYASNSARILVGDWLRVVVIDVEDIPELGDSNSPIFEFHNTPKNLELLYAFTERFREKLNKKQDSNRGFADSYL